MGCHDLKGGCFPLTSVLITCVPQRFITDCIGAKYVGVSTCVWGLCNAVGAIGGGWLLAWVPSSVLFLAVTLGEAACLLFLLVWERTQSLAVVLIFAVSFGLVYGSELGISNGECARDVYEHNLPLMCIETSIACPGQAASAAAQFNLVISWCISG